MIDLDWKFAVSFALGLWACNVLLKIYINQKRQTNIMQRIALATELIRRKNLTDEEAEQQEEEAEEIFNSLHEWDAARSLQEDTGGFTVKAGRIVRGE